MLLRLRYEGGVLTGPVTTRHDRSPGPAQRCFCLETPERRLSNCGLVVVAYPRDLFYVNRQQPGPSAHVPDDTTPHHTENEGTQARRIGHIRWDMNQDQRLTCSL